MIAYPIATVTTVTDVNDFTTIRIPSPDVDPNTTRLDVPFLKKSTKYQHHRDNDSENIYNDDHNNSNPGGWFY